MFGDPDQARDVLEYVVFEKHIANVYGQWRVHGKVVPEWMPSRGALHKTYVKKEPAPLPEIEEEEKKSEVATTTTTPPPSGDKPGEASLATA
jgi:large subunit ribosomal protein L45